MFLHDVGKLARHKTAQINLESFMSAQKLTLVSAALILTACATAQENPHYQHSTQYKGNPLNTPYGAGNTAPTQTAHGYGTTTHYGSNTSTAQAGTVLARVVEPETSQAAADTRQVIYENSSQSAGHMPASYGSTTYSAPSYTRVDAACIEQGLQNTAGCQPTTVAINGQSGAIAQPYAGAPQTLYVTSTTAVSPTEQAMPESYGTPGYEAMKNAESGWAYEPQTTPEWEAVQAPTQSVGVAVPVTQPFSSPLPAPRAREAQIRGASSPVTIQSQENYTLGTQREVREGNTVYSFARELCSSVEEIQAMNSLDGTFNIRLGDTIRLPASRC